MKFLQYEILLQKLRRAGVEFASSLSLRVLKNNFTPACVRMDLTSITDQIVMTVYDPLHVRISPKADDNETPPHWAPHAFGRNLLPKYCSLRDDRSSSPNYGNPCQKTELGQWSYQTCWYKTTEEGEVIASITNGGSARLCDLSFGRGFANFLLIFIFSSIKMAFLAFM